MFLGVKPVIFLKNKSRVVEEGRDARAEREGRKHDRSPSPSGDKTQLSSLKRKGFLKLFLLFPKGESLFT